MEIFCRNFGMFNCLFKVILEALGFNMNNEFVARFMLEILVDGHLKFFS